MAARTQRPGTKTSTIVKRIMEQAVNAHALERGSGVVFQERWTYAPTPDCSVELVGETRFDRPYCVYTGQYGKWLANLTPQGYVRGTPYQVG